MYLGFIFALSLISFIFLIGIITFALEDRAYKALLAIPLCCIIPGWMIIAIMTPLVEESRETVKAKIVNSVAVGTLPDGSVINLNERFKMNYEDEELVTRIAYKQKYYGILFPHKEYKFFKNYEVGP